MALATSTIIAGIGLAVGIASAGVSAYGTMQASEASQDAENLREKQMNLEATRKRREIIRQMILNQAIGKSNAANAGVSVTGDSSVAGAVAQQTNTAAQNTLAVNQSQTIGQGIFDANSRVAGAQAVSAWGQAGQNIGSSIIQNSKTISRVGASYGLWENGY